MMTPSHHKLAALAVTGALGLAQAATTITIDAVDTAFEPNTATAEVGDVVEFVFKPSNHSVVRGSLDKACEPLEEEGFFSGFIPVTEGEPVRLLQNIFRVKITDTKPIYFYCSQGKHCQSGMFGVINPESPEDIEKYKTAAAEAKENKSPSGGVTGGEIIGPGEAGKGTEGETESSSMGGDDGMTMTATATSGTSTATASKTSATPSPSSTSGAMPVGGHRRLEGWQVMVASWFAVAGVMMLVA